jgi:hypothetical protein
LLVPIASPFSANPARWTEFPFFFFIGRRYRRDVAAHRDLFRYARGAIVVPSRADRRRDGYPALENDAPHPGLVLHHNVANPIGLRLTHYGDRMLLSVEIGALVLLVGAQVIAEYERVSREPIETDGRSMKLESKP